MMKVHKGWTQSSQDTYVDTGSKVKATTVLKCSVLVLAGLACIGSISGTGWYMSYSTAKASLESAGEDFMENIPLYVQASLKHRLDPIRFHLQAGLSMLNTKKANVSTWEGIKQIQAYSTPFLQNFFGDTKCCYGVAVNMGFDKADVAPFGGWKEFLDAHQDSWGDDRMVSDVVLIDKAENGDTTVVEVETFHTNGSNTNNWIARPIDPVSYEPLVPKSQAMDFGFTRMSWLDISFETVHRWDLQPTEFRFTPIIMWDITKPNCLKTHGVVPLYENTRIPTDDEKAQFKAGNPPWNPGRRVGVWLIGFKLWFLSELLASMNLKGGFLYLVEKDTGLFVASSDIKVESLKADENGEKTVKMTASEVDHDLISSSAAQLAPGNDWANIEHGMKKMDVAGKPQMLLTFKFEHYGLELQGVYMVSPEIVLQKLNDNATQDAAVSIVLNIVFSGILVAGVFFGGYLSYTRLSAKAREQERLLHVKVHNGLQAASVLAYPMIVVSAQNFLGLSEEVFRSYHEGLRMTGQLIFLDTAENVSAFKRDGNHILFFSYEWLSWTKLGPSDLQLQMMRASVNNHIARLQVPPEKVWIWLDVLSIPQCHKGMQELAINSLYVYAASTSALVVVAPDSQHEGTHAPANLESYRQRVWCRIEQVAMFAEIGIENMFIASDSGLQQLDFNFLSESLAIFDAKMTCCRRKHEQQSYCDKEKLVLPMLGLWFRISAAHRGISTPGDALKLYETYSSDLEKYFPTKFEFSQMHGPVLTRPLFGGLISKVTQIVDKLSDDELRARITNPIDMECNRNKLSEAVIIEISDTDTTDSMTGS